MKKGVFLVVLLYVFQIALPATINVPSDQPTIQAGINAAVSGDTVLIASGTYSGPGNHSISNLGKNIVIKGASGALNTIIDVQGSGANGFDLEFKTISSKLDQEVTIEDISIVNAQWAIYDGTINPTINRCRITNNDNGIWLRGGILDSCVISNNSSYGIQIEYYIVPIVISNCEVSNNGEYGLYSGLEYGESANCRIESSLVEGNQKGLWGTFEAVGDTIRNGIDGVGGNRAGGGNQFTLQNCYLSNLSGTVITAAAGTQIIDTEIAYNSGDIASVVCDRNLHLVRCKIHENTGIGISVDFMPCEYQASLTMDSCIYIKNANGVSFFGEQASGVYGFHINGCTFASNQSDAIYAHTLTPSGTNLSILNTIVAFNSGIGIEVDLGSLVECNNSFQNTNGNYAEIPDQTGVNGNISEDPMFCETAVGDYHISALSPCAPANNDCAILIGALDIGCDDYICGNANGDNDVNISDAVWIINYVFVSGNPPDPLESGDANCDGDVNVSDAVWIINYVFVGGNDPCDTDGDGIPDC